MIPQEGPLGEPLEEAAEAVAPNDPAIKPEEPIAEETALAVLPEEARANGQPRRSSSGEPNASAHTRRTGEDAPTKKLGAAASAADSPEATSAGAPARKSEEEVSLGSHTVNYGMIFKFVGLLVFFALMALICYLVWPTISVVFEEGGAERLVEDIRNAGPLGVLMLLGLQFLQIVVAFIPGEVVQVAAGMMYGPWLGALIIIVGCVASSAFIYWLVHKLGAPFVQAMVPERFLDRLDDFDSSGKLNVVVFVLFLIPGLPKDTFTYIVPLTRMRMGTFLILSNVARIPGVLLSTYAANGLMEGDILTSVLLFLIAAALACIGLYAGRKYMDYKLEKEDPEAWQEVKMKREKKKADRRAKRAKRKSKRAKRKAIKRAKAYEEYKEAQARMRQYSEASAYARSQEQAKGQAQPQSAPRPQAQSQPQSATRQPQSAARPQAQPQPSQPTPREQ